MFKSSLKTRHLTSTILNAFDEQISLLDAEGQILRKHMVEENTENAKVAAPGHVIEKETVPFSRTLRMRRQMSPRDV